ncbi:MAG: DUF3857 domain-containing protein [Acidobacteriota bacterium]
MRGARSPWWALPCLAFLAIGADAAPNVSDAEAQRRLQRGPRPSFVIPATIDFDVEAPDEAKRGLHELLLDTQVDDTGPERVRTVRWVRRVTSEAGLQAVSRVQFSFDPAYETLILHAIRLHRGEQVIDHLDLSQVELLQREPNLEASLYDGERTAVTFLADVRVGDVLDLEWSKTGSNPVLEGRHGDRVDLDWTAPVHRNRFRGLWRADSAPAWRLLRSDLEPSVRRSGGRVELSWDQRDLPATEHSSGLPSWFDPWPRAQLSNWASWNEVARWGHRLFAVPDEPPDECEALLTELRASSMGDAEKARRALRFVQDEVRYLGIELGARAYRPTDPATVMRRRYGDCKDKSVLLVTMLRALGLEADPVLVHAWNGRRVAEMLPTHDVFNHAIVRLELDGRSCWLDPTVLHQRGPLAERHVPDLGWVLVLHPETNELTRVEPQGQGRTRVREHWVSEGLDQPVTLTILSQYDGFQADDLRSTLAHQSTESLAEQYLRFYARQHSGIALSKPLVIKDDEERNVLTVTESYLVEDFWKHQGERQYWLGELWDLQLDNHLATPPQGERTLPFAVTHPVDYELTLRFDLHQDWNVETDHRIVEGAAFRFEHHSRLRQARRLEVRHHLVTSEASLPAEELEQHRRDIDEARKVLAYSLTWAPEVPAWREGGVNWAVLAFVVVTVVLLLHWAVRIYRWRPSEQPELVVSRPIGGWLLLVAFGLVVSLPRLIWDIVEAVPSYSLGTWTSVTIPGAEAHHPHFAPVLLFEAFVNCFLLLGHLLLMVTFFRKMRVLPRLYIGYRLLGLVFVGVNLLVSSDLPGVETGPKEKALYLGQVFFSLLWCLYFRISERVKETFVH